MTRASILLLLFLLAIGPAVAQQPEAPTPPDIMRESARRILDGIRRLIDQMPMFEAPRVTPEGDIILKRLRPPMPETDETKAKVPTEPGGLDL